MLSTLRKDEENLAFALGFSQLRGAGESSSELWILALLPYRRFQMV